MRTTGFRTRRPSFRRDDGTGCGDDRGRPGRGDRQFYRIFPAERRRPWAMIWRCSNGSEPGRWSVPSCGNLVGVNDERCYTCGRRNPGLWGFTPLLRRLGNDLGFTSIVIGGCVALYLLTLLASDGHIGMGGLFSMLSPEPAGAVPVRRERRDAGASVRPVVDHPQRELAARQHPAHPVQHDVGSPARPCHRAAVRREPPGHHLHGGRRDGIPDEFGRRLRAARACPSSAARRSRSAPPPPSSACSARWSSTGTAPAAAWSGPGLVVGRHAVRVRSGHAGRGQLGPRRAGSPAAT